MGFEERVNPVVLLNYISFQEWKEGQKQFRNYMTWLVSSSYSTSSLCTLARWKTVWKKALLGGLFSKLFFHVFQKKSSWYFTKVGMELPRYNGTFSMYSYKSYGKLFFYRNLSTWGNNTPLVWKLSRHFCLCLLLRESNVSIIRLWVTSILKILLWINRKVTRKILPPGNLVPSWLFMCWYSFFPSKQRNKLLWAKWINITGMNIILLH